jgi:hypothetical protein
MKRLLAFAIAVMMVFAMVPVSVSAADAVEVDTEAELLAAIAGSATAIELTGSFAVTSRVYIKGETLTINGNGHTVSVDTTTFVNKDTVDTPYGTTKGAPIFDIVEGSVVTLTDIIFDGKNHAKHGINVYNASVTVENVTSKNNYGSGLTAGSGADVIVTDFNTENNGWYAINVDKGTNKFTFVSGELTEACAFKFDDSTDSKTTADIQGGSMNAIVVADATVLTISGGQVKGVIANGAEADIENFIPDNVDYELKDGVYYIGSDVPASPVNFFMFMFMKRLLTEYAVELVYDETMGLVEIDDEDGYVRFSKDVEITVAALEGYEVESVLVNGEAVELDEDGIYTIKRIRKDAKVEVTFAEIVEDAE